MRERMQSLSHHNTPAIVEVAAEAEPAQPSEETPSTLEVPAGHDEGNIRKPSNLSQLAQEELKSRSKTPQKGKPSKSNSSTAVAAAAQATSELQTQEDGGQEDFPVDQASAPEKKGGCCTIL